MPAIPFEDHSGWWKNRRVDFILIGVASVKPVTLRTDFVFSRLMAAKMRSFYPNL
jgi:hypothetical protein